MKQHSGQDVGSGLAGVFELHRHDLARFLAARCGDSEEAKDLLQELWIRLSTRAIGPIANPRAYLFRMANNLVLNHTRCRHRTMLRDRRWLRTDGDERSPEDRSDPDLLAAEQIERQPEVEILRSAIDALPPGAQRALRLHRLDGHDQGEVGRIMGISRSGVEKHLAVAMRHLRNALADRGYFAPKVSRERGTTSAAKPRTEERP